MPVGGRFELKEAEGGADKSYTCGGIKLCEMSKNMGEDTLILGYGTGCGRGGPPR